MNLLVAFLIFTAAAYAQRHPAAEIDPRTPDGALLTKALQENDPSQKTAILEQFSTQYPKSPSAPWALDTLQAIYVKAGQYDKIVATGEKLLALDPEDPESALQNLKAVEALKDLPGIRKWSALASTNARKMAATPQPKDPADVESWKSDVSYAKQVDTYTEYALFRVALENSARDPKVTLEFAEVLEARNPDSPYMAQTRTAQFVAYRQTGANDKAVALAERVLATDQSNEDMLMVVADDYATHQKEPSKVHEYTSRAIAVMAAKPAPAGMSEADWTARRNNLTGLAHYLSGKLYYGDKNYPDTDRELRAALPLMDAALKAEVLFMLGDANFNLKKPQEAVTYFRACAALPGPMQAQATKNLQALKAK